MGDSEGYRKAMKFKYAKYIKTGARQPGFYALRAALILAAADPDGLTLLNVLRKFPTRGIRLDLARSLEIAEELENFVNQTNQAIALVSQQSTAAATTSPYGFAVAVPEHPGSNSEQLRSLLAGRSDEVTQPREFIDRPLDVKYLLDELERLDASNPNLQLNLQQVGVIGQSFGGYTVLALAGASLNFEQLQKDCKALENSLDVSLLLQCRALELPRTQYNLRDERVKAAIAINPITRSIFGKDGMSDIQIPVTLVSSSADKIAPALPEQIQPFTWLNNPEKYLVLLEGGTHFSTLGQTNPETQPLAIPSQVIGPNPAIARRYLDALSVAFFKTYIAGEPQYRPYLSANYARSISQASLGLSLVRSLSEFLPLPQASQLSPKTNSVSKIGWLLSIE